jgi:hypothetical protein
MQWKDGRMEGWKDGRMLNRPGGRRSLGAAEPAMTLLGLYQLRDAERGTASLAVHMTAARDRSPPALVNPQFLTGSFRSAQLCSNRRLPAAGPP